MLVQLTQAMARLEALLRSELLQIDGWVVSKAKVKSRLGSAQKTVPVAPPCPKLPGERKSPKNPQQDEGASLQPSPPRIITFCAFGTKGMRLI